MFHSDVQHLLMIRFKLGVTFRILKNIYPGSRYGLSRFDDIPISPFGDSSNEFYEMVHLLGTSIHAFTSSFAKLVGSGGMDYSKDDGTLVAPSLICQEMAQNRDWTQILAFHES
eukprot:GHVP01043531.1.p1 GENE.GHVP01043531.1~~GHVP01043531.1.p1  ORF type:complete len:114 (-),score=3.32 GHVP01043531.1:655-996(-)